MRRFELFEIHDHRWCPAILRNLFTDALQAIWMMFDSYRMSKLDKIPEAELIAEVPTYAQQDHLTIEVPTRKHCLPILPITHPVPSFSNNTVCE
jgi:hypothetical protein